MQPEREIAVGGDGKTPIIDTVTGEPIRVPSAASSAIARNADRLYAAAEALGRASDAVDRLTEEDIDGHEWPVLDAVTTVNELADLLLGLAEGEANG